MSTLIGCIYWIILVGVPLAAAFIAIFEFGDWAAAFIWGCMALLMVYGASHAIGAGF